VLAKRSRYCAGNTFFCSRGIKTRCLTTASQSDASMMKGTRCPDCCGVRVLVSRGLTPPQKPTGESGPPPINYLARPRLDVNVGRPLSQGANIEILTFCAILLSPVIAVLITVWLQNRKERRGTKLWVFNRNKNNPPTRPHLHSIQELLFFLVIFIWQTSFCKYRA